MDDKYNEIQFFKPNVTQGKNLESLIWRNNPLTLECENPP